MDKDFINAVEKITDKNKLNQLKSKYAELEAELEQTALYILDVIRNHYAVKKRDKE